MSLNYARELLKISLSQMADRIGFDSTSEMALDILVDVCERQFHQVLKQTSTMMQFTARDNVHYCDALSHCFQEDQEHVHDLHTYMKQFQSITFPQDIIQFPSKKRNQFFLRIPPKDSPQVIDRDLNQSTEYIYDWLPLFPDQETPEQPTTNQIDTNHDATIYTDQERRIEKSDSHHPLTLLSFLSKIGDEPNAVPVGKRPNRSLPSVLFRPRRLIELEVAAAAAEKAKKELLEKETTEKDQQQGPPPPLRLTLPKATTNNEKSSLPLKKSSTTPAIEGSTTLKKPPSSNPLLTTTSPSLNLSKKNVISPTIIHEPLETHSQPTPSIASFDSVVDKNNDVVLDLSKPTAHATPAPTPPATSSKLPTLKLNIKHMPTPANTNQDNLPLATKKSQRPPSQTPKTSSKTHEKVNLKIRAPSLPLFGNNTATTSDSKALISPPLLLNHDIRSTLAESTPLALNEIKPTVEITDSTNRIEPMSSTADTSMKDEEKKKKKKKKQHHDRDAPEGKRIKIEPVTPIVEPVNQPMQIDPLPPVLPEPTPTASSTNPPVVAAIRLKIKLGKPSVPVEPTASTDVATSSHSHEADPPAPRENKPNPIRLTLPLGNKSSQPPPPPPPPTTTTTTPHRRKSSKVKRVPPSHELVGLPANPATVSIPFHEDNTNSIDDLPLGERTSPNKPLSNPIESNTFNPVLLTTPVKKKTSSNNKKKTSQKKVNNIVGVAVIEERRIDHDSQEKIWICPSCNIADNGQEPMIQCDLCDDWYHWECVGIAEEPPESIPWFCPKCHRSNSSTASAQGIKPSASSKAKRKRASALYQQKQQQQQQANPFPLS